VKVNKATQNLIAGLISELKDKGIEC